MGTFSQWFSINKLDSIQIPNLPGVYEIASEKKCQRCIGIDLEGILHIGETVNLRSRITNFKNCAKDQNVKGHMAGWRYSNSNLLSNQFPINTLKVRWVICDDKDHAIVLESNRLKAYYEKHGEQPPLNYKANWKYLRLS